MVAADDLYGLIGWIRSGLHYTRVLTLLIILARNVLHRNHTEFELLPTQELGRGSRQRFKNIGEPRTVRPRW